MIKNRIQGAKAVDVVSANDLTIGNGTFQTVTGNTQINGIRTLNWNAGAQVALYITGTPRLKHNTAASAGFASLFLAGEADFDAYINAMITFEYDGTYWREKCRGLLYQEADFTVTFTGVTTTVTGTARYVRVGKAVTLYIPSMSGTSNATTCTLTGLPAIITPARSGRVPISELRDNGSDYPGGAQIETNGTITLFRHAAIPGGLTNFTAAGQKAIGEQFIQYHVL